MNDELLKSVVAALIYRYTGTTTIMVRAQDIDDAVGPFGGIDGFDLVIEEAEKGGKVLGVEVWLQPRQASAHST